MVEQELVSNPFLEEAQITSAPSLSVSAANSNAPEDTYAYRQSLITRELTLQDILLRQLGMFTDCNEDFQIGQEIIGNIDENGYLQATVEEISQALKVTPEKTEKVLKIIQQFDPPGVAARSIPECLLIQLELDGENDPLIVHIIKAHLDDLSKKNYTRIAKALKEPIDKVEAAVKKILRLNPKPGRDYCGDAVHHVVPDIVVEEKDGDLEVTINGEDLPALSINKAYREMLKKMDDPIGKKFLAEKLRNALELLRAITKRNRTLKKVIEIIVEIQEEALRNDLSYLKPLTFHEVAQRLEMHETTVCRVVMSKYVQTPHGVFALKDFFPSRIQDKNGHAVSSSYIKQMIKDLIDAEDKKHPLSDQDIVQILGKEKNVNVARRTVAKYREELKILSTAFRRVR
jgi:RNA polymerase sigma-54 factor